MVKVNVATLKAELSKYLDMAQNGEQVIVTSHGEEIAKIGPASNCDSFAGELKEFFTQHPPIKPKKKIVRSTTY